MFIQIDATHWIAESEITQIENIEQGSNGMIKLTLRDKVVKLVADPYHKACREKLLKCCDEGPQDE